jgi:hypothetical protein
MRGKVNAYAIFSGLDRPLFGALPQTSNRQSCISKDLDSAPWSDRNMYYGTSCGLPGSKEASLVSHIEHYEPFPQTDFRNNRYIPPHLDRTKSNVENSENTTLFLVSCFEYILSGVVLSVGPPFRQAMSQNCKQTSNTPWDRLLIRTFVVPFVVTIVATVLFSCYMLFDPAIWLASFMQLTYMALDFRVFILTLGVGYFIMAWVAEKYLLVRLAKVLGLAKEKLGGFPKRRKAYKLIQAKMRV